MQNGASRPGGRPLNCPHRPTPQPIIHRQHRRRQREWVDGTTLQGKEYWKTLGMMTLWMLGLLLIWWFTGK